jgi:hypothetical protein
MIQEVSLVLSGANPGALIDNVTLAHGDDDFETLDDEAIIFTGLGLEHSDQDEEVDEEVDEDIEHAAGATVKDVYDTLTKEQKDVVHYMIGAALDAADNVKHSDDDESLKHDSAMDAPYDNGNRETKSSGNSASSTVTNSDGSVTSTTTDGNVRTTTITYNDGTVKTIVDDTSSKYTTTTTTNADGVITHQEGPTEMSGRNVFDQDKKNVDEEKHTLSHADVKEIVADAARNGSLREAVESYALKHGITDIDLMFPDAKLLTSAPEFVKRRTEWVAGVLGSTRHSPFSRVKTLTADLTQEQARARGYIKGNMKKEEWFGLSKRTTSPTTVYKKQKLDRDDMIDITDFDIVAWLKGEMRLMLEEEIARAILIGDGRDVSNEDKVKDPIGAADGVGIRSIANDHELFTTTVYVNVDDANSSYEEVVDAVMDGMEHYKGTGTPDLYTTIRTINMFLKAKDTLGRRIYANRTEVAAALGVANVIPVEAMNDEPNIVGIIVNLYDYNIGADKGGEVSLFDDFDIDYNQQKYLIETRLSGALTKVKSALVVRKVAASSVLATPIKPSFNGLHSVVIPTVTGVVYKNAETGAVLTNGSTVTLVADQTLFVTVVPTSSSYYFASSDNDWLFTYGG